MAPSFSIELTQVYAHPTEIVSAGIYRTPYIKPETKEAKIKRVATSKMLASWKSHNEKMVNIIEIKRVCKPIHRLWR